MIDLITHVLLKDYDKIMTLAEDGDEGKVSVFQRDLKSLISDGDSDSYSDIPEGIMLFSLAKVLNSKSRSSGLNFTLDDRILIDCFMTKSLVLHNIQYLYIHVRSFTMAEL